MGGLQISNRIGNGRSGVNPYADAYVYYKPSIYASYPNGGDTLFDLSPNGNDSEIVGGVTSDYRSLIMNGIDSGVNPLSSMKLFPQSTTHLWVKKSNTNSVVLTQDGPNYFGLMIGENIVYNRISSSTVTMSSTDLNPINEYYLFTQVRNGTNVKLYIDGVLQFSKNGLNSTYELPINYLFNSNGGSNIQGNIGLFAIYNRVDDLTAIEEFYDATSAEFLADYNPPFLKSSGDLHSPQVGDILYFEHFYKSVTGNLQDYENTVIEFKRDGVVIPLVTGAKQYIIQQADIGSMISLSLTIKEQGGHTQSVVTESCFSSVSGSGWTFGDIQSQFESIFDFTVNEYPRMQRYCEDDGVNLTKVKSLTGTDIDLKYADNVDRIEYSLANLNCFAPNVSSLFFTNEMTDWDGSNGTMFFKFQLPSTVGTFDLFKNFGTTDIELVHNNVSNRLELSGGVNSPDNSVNPDDELIVIIRFSDTAFTTIEPVAGQKTEMYIRTDDGAIVTEFHVDSVTNSMNGSDHDYSWLTGKTKISFQDMEVKAIGFSTRKINDTDFNNLLTHLIAL